MRGVPAGPREGAPSKPVQSAWRTTREHATKLRSPCAHHAIRAGDWFRTCHVLCLSLFPELLLLPKLRLPGLTAACSRVLCVPQQNAPFKVQLQALVLKLTVLCREGEKLRVLPCRHRFHMVRCLQRCLCEFAILRTGQCAACIVL